MSGETLEAVLAAFGERLGLGPIALDENGVCALSVDAKLIVHMAHDEGEGRAVIYAPLGSLPAGEREPLLTRMLEGNAVSWATVALEPALGQPVLLHRFAVSGMDRHRLELLLERFIQAATEWQNILASSASAANESPIEMSALHQFMGHGIRA